MQTKNLIPVIRLSETEQDRLKIRLDEMIGCAEEFRNGSRWEDQHRQYWDQYLSKPKFAVRNSPWPGASNIVVPMTEVAVNGAMAHEFDAMLTNDPIIKVITTKPSRVPNIEQWEDDAKALTEYWAGFYRDVINLRQLGADWLLDTFVDGTGAVKARIDRDTVVRREQTSVEVMSADGFGSDMQTVEDAFVERRDEIANDVSDLNDLWFAPGSYVSANMPNQFAYPYTPWYYQTQEIDESGLIERGRSGYDVGKAHGTSGSTIDDLFAHSAEQLLSRKEQSVRETEATANTVEKSLRACEFYMRWPIPSKYQTIFDGKQEEVKQAEADETGYAEELIVTYVPGARHIMRIVPLYRVYPDGKRPHVPSYYMKFSRYIYGRGIPARLLHLQSAGSTTFNQGFDWGSMSILPHGYYNPGSMGVMPEAVEIRPGALIATSDPRGVNYPRTQFDPNFHPMIMSMIERWAELVTNINANYVGNQGKNSPKTARGTIALLQQSNLMTSILVAMHAESFVELAKRNHALKRKYAKESTPYRTMNSAKGNFESKTISRRAFDIEADFQFVLNPNRQEEQQMNQTLYSIFTQAIQFAIQVPQVAPNIRMALGEIYESAGKKNFNQLWPQDMIQVAPPQPQPGLPGQAPPGGMEAMQPGGGMPPGPPMASPLAGMPPQMPTPMMPPTPPSIMEWPTAEPVAVTPEEESIKL
jgi:hypothetical protein